MEPMATASIRDLHIRTPELAIEPAAGAVTFTECCGEPVAELRPLTQNSAGSRLPDLTEFWARMPSVPGESGRYLEEDR